MNVLQRLTLAGTITLTLGWSGTAGAAAIILDITADGPGLGLWVDPVIDNGERELALGKMFDAVDSITLTFTVGHGTGGGGPFDVTESIFNGTGIEFTDFHFTIVEPGQGSGVVFTSFNQSTLEEFTLDSPPSSGPRNLNFTGSLDEDSFATAVFNLSLFDPGAGNTYTFELIQTPTVVPEPTTWALAIVGLLGVAGAVRRRL